MVNFISFNRDQSFLLPPDLRAHFGIKAERMMLGVGWAGNL